jgi:hypothetical protein
MGKKNSMYINDYQVMNYMPKNTNTEESKQEYLDYLQSLINYLQDLKTYAEDTDTKAPLNMFYECQAKLVTLKGMLNAELLSAWHNNITYELEKEVRELRNRVNKM